MPLEPDDIQALATALKNLPGTEVNATAVKLPNFWPGNPDVWFKQVESIFSTRHPAITTQQTKFDYVIQALDNSSADRVQNIILDPPGEPYDKIKSALVSAFGKSQAQKDQELLNLNGLGDRKPSELLQHMKNLNSDRETMFKALFMAQLPHDVRRILASSTKTELDDLAAEADRITEVSRLTEASPVNASSTGTTKNRTRTTGRSRTPPGSVTGSHFTSCKADCPTLPGLCKYHAHFGVKARSCVQPCKVGSATCPENLQSGRR